MKKKILYGLFFLGASTLMAQGVNVTFTAQSNNIGNYADYSEVATDMNGDFLDDYVRVSQTGVGIDYQQPDGTFNSVFYTMNIPRVPDWSIAVGDLNGNGLNDMVLGNSQRVNFLLSKSDGSGYILDESHPEYIFSQRSTMADIDNDGDLDAFVCHDVDQSHPYRNNGSGLMNLDQSLITTIDLPGNYAAIWVDYDNDGDQDMYLTKCRGGSQPGDIERDNAMYTNLGNGNFIENAAIIGMKDNAQSWSTVFEDFDNDGDFDAFIVNHDFQNRFMVNDGDGLYTDQILTSGINPTDLGAWENQAADFNNDGFVDIFSEMSRELYINNGDMTFTGVDLSFDEGGIGDFNNDGFLDVANDGTIYYNDGNANNWIKVGLKGIESNNNGIGARVQIYGDWGMQSREIRSGQGFSHMSTLNAHFGIAQSTTVDMIEIHWPSGIVDQILNPNINTITIIEEGSAPLATTDFQKEGINIYPNPTSDILNFSLKGLENTAITIVDVSGKNVLSGVISSSNNFNVSAIAEGIYFVKLSIENKNVSYKFIKK